MRVIMLSPCPFDGDYGGVQKTAQLAWETVASCPGADGRLVCYGAECGANGDAKRSCNSSKLRGPVVGSGTVAVILGRVSFWLSISDLISLA
jgi:hypothetical protein